MLVLEIFYIIGWLLWNHRNEKHFVPPGCFCLESSCLCDSILRI